MDDVVEQFPPGPTPAAFPVTGTRVSSCSFPPPAPHPLLTSFLQPRSPRPRVFRELTFLENKATIDAHNALPGVTFKLGYTQFADKSVEEFTRNQLRYKQRHSLREKRAEKLYRAAGAYTRRLFSST